MPTQFAITPEGRTFRTANAYSRPGLTRTGIECFLVWPITTPLRKTRNLDPRPSAFQDSLPYRKPRLRSNFIPSGFDCAHTEVAVCPDGGSSVASNAAPRATTSAL